MKVSRLPAVQSRLDKYRELNACTGFNFGGELVYYFLGYF